MTAATAYFSTASAGNDAVDQADSTKAETLDGVIAQAVPSTSDIPPGFVKATYDWTARGETELTFKVGDLILVEGQYDDAWWKGKLGDAEGFFPATYVRGLENIVVFDDDDDEPDYQDDEYFRSYATLIIHHEMLTDEPRTAGYKRATEALLPYIRGKVVI